MGSLMARPWSHSTHERPPYDCLMAAYVAYESSQGVFRKPSYSLSPPRRRNRRAARTSNLDLSGINSPKFDPMTREGIELGYLGTVQESIDHEVVQVDQQRVPGKSRGRLIGRVPITGRSDRQHLPQFLAGVGESPGELSSLFTQRANSMWSRERCDVGENAALARHPEVLSSGNWANRTWRWTSTKAAPVSMGTPLGLARSMYIGPWS